MYPDTHTPARESAAAEPFPHGASQRCGRVLVTTEVPEQKTAWTKARRDVQAIAGQEVFGTLQLPTGLASWDWPPFFARLGRLAGEGATVLVEYPFAQRRRLYPLFTYCRLKRIRLLGLIHDLNALRLEEPQSREMAILRMFDGLVSHNAEMSRWLRGAGFSGPLADLGLFDYLLPGPPRPAVWHAPTLRDGPLKVLCAGNLSQAKAGYIYDPRLGALEGVDIGLFGAFFEPGRMPDSPVRYHGAFDPDTPELDQRYHFGLVWDGDSAQRVQGRYGHYMRYNNPHKISLYAALGLPVVVWEESAAARFVLAQGVGVTVGDLRELGNMARQLSDAEYARMAVQMGRLRVQVTQGRFLRSALQALDEA